MRVRVRVRVRGERGEGRRRGRVNLACKLKLAEDTLARAHIRETSQQMPHRGALELDIIHLFNGLGVIKRSAGA